MTCVEWRLWRYWPVASVRASAPGPGILFSGCPPATLASAITAAVGIFAVLNSLVFQNLPYSEPDRIVRVLPQYRASPFTGTLSGMAFERWRDTTTHFASIGAFTAERRIWNTIEGGSHVDVALVTPSVFSVLGISTRFGRPFRSTDERSTDGPVVILVHAFWRARFGGDAAIIGAPLVLGGVQHEIIGVLPPDVRLPYPDAAVWIPLDPRYKVETLPSGSPSVSVRHVQVVGRLRSGATLESVRVEGAAVTGEPPPVILVKTLWEDATIGIRAPLLMLQGLVVVVLAVACANIANLLLARTLRRRKDIAVRVALGASEARVTGDILAESLLCTVPAGILGYWGAWLVTEALRTRGRAGWHSCRDDRRLCAQRPVARRPGRRRWPERQACSS